MDYVREELLRQNRALEALMKAGVTEREEQEPEASMPQSGEAEGRERDTGSAEAAASGARLREASFREPLAQKEWTLPAEPAGSGAVIPGAAGGLAHQRQERARDVSRAIERDARRYDGGFAMY